QFRLEPREIGLRRNLDVGAAEDVGVLHHVRGDHAEAPALEGTCDAGGSGERVDGDAAADAAPRQDALDEVQKTGLVADVAHRLVRAPYSGQAACAAPARAQRRRAAPLRTS